MKKASALVIAALLSLTAPSFATTLCSVTGNIVSNCGFENGSYSSTLNSNTNPGVPNSWTPNAAYDLDPANNQLTATAHSGSYGLSIGNPDGQPTPTLSQILTDIAGATYTGTLFVGYTGAGDNDTRAFFDTQIDTSTLVGLNDAAAGAYTQYTFSFTGTGSDVLTLNGNTSAGEWMVDDITIVESAPPFAVAPEPPAVALLGTALLGLATLRKRLIP